MSVQVAYGKRENILPAIDAGIIPKNCIIVTKDTVEAEMFFYDSNGQLSVIAERTRFDTLDEAKEWIQKYSCKGNVVSVKNDNKWIPYIIQDDCNLSPIESKESLIEIVKAAGKPLNIQEKSVNIPIATSEIAGLVVSSELENHIEVNATGHMEVNNVNVNKLVQTKGDTFILDSGTSEIK